MDRRLQQFLAVAETGNVSRAAKALNVSQPTVSVNLRRLEEEHQVPLFKRSSRGVVLTEFGAVLYDHVRAMARLDLHSRAEIQAMRANREHGLRIGCGFAWWRFPLRDVVAGFRTDNPDLSVLVDVSNSLDGLRKLLAGDTALFLGTEVKNLKPDLSVRFTPLFTAPHTFFARENHPLAGHLCSRADIDRFERMDVVPVEASHIGLVNPGGTSATGQTATSLRPVLSSSSMTVCIDLLNDSDAILGYPRSLASHFAVHGIIPLNLREGDFSEVVGLYHLDERARDLRLQDMQERIERVLDQSDGPGDLLQKIG